MQNNFSSQPSVENRNFAGSKTQKNEDEIIEDEKYHFIDNDELQKDFMSGAGISTTNIPEKVFFYIYTIEKPVEDYPFLKVFLRTGPSSGILELPSVDISKDDVLGGQVENFTKSSTPQNIENDLNEMFLNECMEKFTTEIIKDHEIATNYKEYYKGFILHDEKIVIVFHLEGSGSGSGTEPPQNKSISDSGLTITVIDEIINKKSVNNVPIDDYIRRFLYDNLNCLYITTESFENVEIPQVFYGGETLVRSVSEYGFFYNLSSIPSDTLTKKYVGFIENKMYHAKKNTETAKITQTDINREFDASIIVDPEGINWYFKCLYILFAL